MRRRIVRALFSSLSCWVGLNPRGWSIRVTILSPEHKSIRGKLHNTIPPQDCTLCIYLPPIIGPMGGWVGPEG